MPPNVWQKEAFRSELRALGYEEGNNIAIEWRQSIEVAEIEGGRKLVVDLLRMKIDVVVTAGTVASRAAMEASDKVPVVFAPVGDPVSSGLALSLAHPGKNGTGVSVVSTELYPKRLEILHALAPRARRIGYLGNSSNPAGTTLFGETVAGAAKLGLQLERIDVRKSSELDAAWQTMQASKLDAVLVGGDSILATALWKVADAVRKAKLPAIFAWREWHRYGVLLSYGPSMTRSGARPPGLSTVF